MKKYENPELKLFGLAFENDVLTTSVIDFDNAETGSDKDDTVEPGQIG